MLLHLVYITFFTVPGLNLALCREHLLTMVVPLIQ
jgi:hypothetical protein